MITIRYAGRCPEHAEWENNTLRCPNCELDTGANNLMESLKPVLKDLDKELVLGAKYDQDKYRPELLSTIALVEISKVLTFGAKKYADHNWRKGISYSRLLGACLRHVFAYLGGESKDPETGLSHLAHASCCLIFILDYELTKPEFDDRFKK